MGKIKEIKEKHPDNWQFLSASSKAIFPSRWSTLWDYVIRGRVPEYTLEAWVHHQGKIGETVLRLIWK